MSATCLDERLVELCKDLVGSAEASMVVNRCVEYSMFVIAGEAGVTVQGFPANILDHYSLDYVKHVIQEKTGSADQRHAADAGRCAAEREWV